MSDDALAVFHAASADAAKIVRDLPSGTRWFLHCDSDADGISAAAVTAMALRRIGHRFQVRAHRDKTEGAYAEAMRSPGDGHMFLDKGTSHVAQMAAAAQGKPVIVIDHHNLIDDVPRGVSLVNPRAAGLDGSNDASSGTTAVAFALALVGDVAWDWAGIGLVGAIGDWQHMGGWDGWNRRLVEEGKARGVLHERTIPAYIGIDLATAIAGRTSPEIPGVTGDIDATRRWLASIDVPAAADVERLTDDEVERLLSAVGPDAPTTQSLQDPRLGGLRHAFRIIDACAREGKADTGLALLMGDDSVRDEAEACFAGYHAAIGAGVDALHRDGTEVRDACQIFAARAHAYTGMIAGIGMTHVVTDRSRPMVVHAPRPDGLIQISTRGTNEQVAAGMDLGRACQAAGHRIGREGGGHPIAAGIIVAPEEVERFLPALDSLLVGQGFLD